LTAHEIICFWVARMIIMGLKFMGDVPFSDFYIHPMVFDEKTKKKMSKSLGNIIDPIEMIEKYGTDAMRMTLCAYAVKGSNLYLSEERFQGYRNFMNKFWNSARFVLMNTEDLTSEDLANGLDEDALRIEDRWILGELHKLVEQIDASLTEYEFDQYVHKLYHFVWGEYCDWYLELVKGRLYSDDPADAASGKNAQIVLVTVLEALLRLLHPATPFITEEVWQRIRERYEGLPEDAPLGVGRALKADSIIIASWPEAADYPASDQTVATKMQTVQEAVTALRKIRSEMTVPPSRKVDVTVRSTDSEALGLMREQAHHLEALARIGKLEFAEGESGESKGVTATAVVGPVELSVALPPELIEAEKQRLQKEIENLEKGMIGAKKKLENPNFVEKAPEKVVNLERERLEKAEQEVAVLRERLEKISG
ncbi:MAG: class I tRNA ligase family protein, partial [Candidatus Sumerlaeota bacterium]